MRAFVNNEGRLTIEFIYAHKDNPFALVEELWSERPSPLYEGASIYHRAPQFGGDPGFRDVWGDEADEAMLARLVQGAIQTEIDIATLGYGWETMPTTYKLPVDPDLYEVEIFEFIKTGIPPDMTGHLNNEQLNFLENIGLAAAKRVATALSIIY